MPLTFYLRTIIRSSFMFTHQISNKILTFHHSSSQQKSDAENIITNFFFSYLSLSKLCIRFKTKWLCALADIPDLLFYFRTRCLQFNELQSRRKCIFNASPAGARYLRINLKLTLYFRFILR